MRLSLRYGSDTCAIVSSDARYSKEIVALRNDTAVNRFIHTCDLTEEMHLQWLASEQGRDDVLNFVILVQDNFAGTISLTDIQPGESAQLGRFVMPDDWRRLYALAAEFLCLSFAFEVLKVRSVWCRVAPENSGTLRFHLQNGWILNPDRNSDDELGQTGLSISKGDWPAAMASKKSLLERLHDRSPQRGCHG